MIVFYHPTAIKMGASLLFHILSVPCLILFSTVCVRGQIDKAFCDKYAPPGSGTQLPMPHFSKDFKIITEQTLTEKKRVSIGFEVYSELQQMLYFDERSPSNRTILYIFPKLDMYLATITPQFDDPKCITGKLDNANQLKQLFGIKKVKGVFTLPVTNYLVSFTSALPAYHQGTTTVRGIPAETWSTCAYQAASGTTSAIYLYFSNKYTMPWSDTSVFLRMDVQAKSRGQASDHPTKSRYDFTHVQNKITAQHPFTIPKQEWCKDRPKATNLPIPPVMFQFQSEQTDIGDPNLGTPAKPALGYFKQTYLGPLKLYEIDTERTGDKVLSKFRETTFHDFNTGMQYKLDYSEGKCAQSPITEGDDVVATGLNGVRITNAYEFFDLAKGDYQYMGQHLDMDRGIDCDVFLSVIQNGTVNNPITTQYTWYFATKNWQTNVMAMESHSFFPVRVTIQTTAATNDFINYDIYRFTDQPGGITGFPDLSPCYDVGQEMYIDILLEGRYDYVYLSGANSFIIGFSQAVVKYTSEFSLYRTTDIVTEPSDKYNTVVHFTLLDAVPPIGDVQNRLRQAPSKQVYKQLQDAIASKKFVFKIKNNLGEFTLRGVAIRQRIFKPAAPTENNPTVNNKDDSVKSSSINYGDGAMGGLACGMLVVGVIIGFVAFKLIRRLIIRRKQFDIPMVPYESQVD